MTTTEAAFIELREEVRNSIRQFRDKNDNSTSIFNPTNGFKYAYDIQEIEQALSKFEETEFGSNLGPTPVISIEQELLNSVGKVLTTDSSPTSQKMALLVSRYLSKLQVPNTAIRSMD